MNRRIQSVDRSQHTLAPSAAEDAIHRPAQLQTGWFFEAIGRHPDCEYPRGSAGAAGDDKRFWQEVIRIAV